ncbi:MAG: hypothetical protein ACI4HZ_01355 [Ruminococcus sp.]
MKTVRIIPLFLLTIILLCGCTKTTSAKITTDINDAVSKAILTDNKDAYYDGECQAEGHVIFETEKTDNKYIVYSYIGYSEYGFENGNFVDVSGTMCPAVITLDKNYNLIEIKYPEDGSDYAKSIKKMFSRSCVNNVLNISDKNHNSIIEQETEYAKEYLKSIGRDATIGTMSDFEYPLLTDMGVSVEVSNSLSENVLIDEPYPYWIGNKELVENDIRYVYQMDYNKNENKIIFTKYQYEKPNNILEKIVVDSLSGKEIKE